MKKEIVIIRSAALEREDFTFLKNQLEGLVNQGYEIKTCTAVPTTTHEGEPDAYLVYTLQLDNSD
jgi:hypothetical protein